MKKAAEVKYPHSANLFQFCRRVLDHKFGGIRVIDQDVGQILGFDPADCSHWKKGKKNIRSIQAMKSIAEHLGIDEKLVVDVAAGELGDREAFLEYTGYGAFRVDPKLFEAAKKDFYRRHAGNWSKEKEEEFRRRYTACETTIDAAVKEIHEKISFEEPPLYLPEVVTAFSQVTMVPEGDESSAAPADDEAPVTVEQQGSETRVRYPAGTEMRPYMRYRIAKALASHFLDMGARDEGEPTDYDRHLQDVQSNLFAAKLLSPAPMIRRELGQVNVSKDVVSQLAEIFWVSKTFMNRRLRDILQTEAEL